MLSWCAQQRGSAGWAAAIVGLVTGAGAADAQEEAPALQISWSVGEGPMNHAFPAGSGNGDGSYVYEGAIVDDATGLVLTYKLTGDPSANLDGNLSLENDLGETIQVFASAIMPRSIPLPQGSLMSGMCVVGLTTDPVGGQLSSLPPWLWQAVADDAVVGPSASLFADPFHVAHGGPASSAATSQFGTPEPVPGPQVNTTFGFQIRYTLTPFDLASITTTFTTVGAFTSCAGDIDGDGEVGVGDLGDMLGAWGTCPPAADPCPADLDGDGTVGVGDFLKLLALWGPCP